MVGYGVGIGEGRAASEDRGLRIEELGRKLAGRGMCAIVHKSVGLAMTPTGPSTACRGGTELRIPGLQVVSQERVLDLAEVGIMLSSSL